ncbi:related to salicylate 1-monooxygenase [Fusarium mangiferae]|uniref:Related to salicylate 1-monooxygenase n=1 Tax=Fusarium mangiferae TaxID=192010 RepID=A0A1L7SXS1_FUSMA|nr:uncharacterized protein FMAN_05363 [Fusarium mangiferae]CVK87777.1 related to salicylate 1-monooxygenase [Fusarium mangiferae]
MVLKVGVIGAGIGGLSAAIALRRTGAQVEVFERSSFKDEIGAAITITPNGMRVLRHFGFDPKTARGVQNKQMRMVHPQTLEDLVVENFRHVENDYGAPFMFFHRVDLHTALKEMALSSDEQYPGLPVVIHNGHSVTSLDCENATIMLDNGETFAKDLLVVADGVRVSPVYTMLPSSVADLLGPNSSTKLPKKMSLLKISAPHFTGVSSPSRRLIKTPILPPSLKTKIQDSGSPLTYLLGPFSLHIPVGMERCSTSLFVTRLKLKMSTRSIGILTRTFKTSLPCLSTSVSVYKLFRREPLETYTRGRAVIIGDAAHPIQPTHAQGAVLATEEAAALEVLFKDIQRPEKVTEGLSLYNDILKRRIHVTQLLSDAQPGISSVLRQRAEDIWGEGIFPPDAMNFTRLIRDFFYSYDVMEEAEKVLTRAI